MERSELLLSMNYFLLRSASWNIEGNMFSNCQHCGELLLLQCWYTEFQHKTKWILNPLPSSRKHFHRNEKTETKIQQTVLYNDIENSILCLSFYSFPTRLSIVIVFISHGTTIYLRSFGEMRWNSNSASFPVNTNIGYIVKKLKGTRRQNWTVYFIQ